MRYFSDMDLLGILLLPLILVLGLFGLFCLVWPAIYARSWLKGVSLYLRLWRRRRTMSALKCIRELEHGSGTLIVEGISVGFPFSRAWWTEENVTQASPFPPWVQEVVASKESDKSRIEASYQFTRWVEERYTSAETGCAKLVQAYKGYQWKEKRCRKLPHMMFLYIHPILAEISHEEALMDEEEQPPEHPKTD